MMITGTLINGSFIVTLLEPVKGTVWKKDNLKVVFYLRSPHNTADIVFATKSDPDIFIMSCTTVPTVL